MSKLSLRTMLYALAIVPLIAFLWASLNSTFSSYRIYEELDTQLYLQRVGEAGGRLAQALPSETFATPQQLKERRAVTDTTYAGILSAYDDWKNLGASDPVIEKSIAELKTKMTYLATYRTHVDNGTATDDEALTYLQPAAAYGLELVRRAGAAINDITLSHALDGYHALLQVSDAGLIEIEFGKNFLGGRALSLPEYAFLAYAKGLRARYGVQVAEFLPPEVTSDITKFDQSPDGQFLTQTLEVMYINEPVAQNKAAVARWSDATLQRAGIISDAIAKTGALVERQSVQKLESLKSALYNSALISFIVSALVISLSALAARQVSSIIHSIQNRMKALADGDVNAAIPCVERSDEIGDMARSVEIFRQAAIRNHELEAQAEASRRRSEEERIEVQRRAEADAEERLNKATGSLATGLQRLASGDLLCEINEQFAPQFEALRHDFNSSVVQLRSAILAVGESASAVRGGSGEISHASNDLAKRTEVQAASLEETAAALEEITSNVKSTTSRTGEARDLVRDARDRADKSGVVVSNAVNAMGRIEDASKQIAQIIGVIDEIAFQTNLLALNAGVEAARAGEAGKGFAVVAQEVRELAQRSATAAKEIKQLISNSEIAVSEGVKLVNETGSGLGAIATVVEAINKHMDAIATAAQEQSVGLAEVNTAVNHMDQATQQNAAMVEETSAASAGLAEEARKLAELIAGFRVGHVQPTQSAQRGVAPSVPLSRPRPVASRPVVSSRVGAAVAKESWEEF
ncbi:methyl-accepting chemotaxis protein [Rhizobium oryziradicis]|uniref:Chemotaxis protein n=1 Tax=Rhizobium oryziradicis TaxID=1867956 RepID=A0A1Q8ZQZ2_9HYPH|nr:HAMP domain-containing methyl-accepting chemotaxis protein [Rhizobium oryziradicis]OLP44477.1 hypothetical protein BJF95_08125 [Rhizobium oryziradicis]